MIALLIAGLCVLLTKSQSSDDTDLFCPTATSAPPPNVMLLFSNTPSMNDLACARFSGDTMCDVQDNGTNYFLNLRQPTSLTSLTLPQKPPSSYLAYTTGHVYSETISASGAWGWTDEGTINNFCTTYGLPDTCSTNLTDKGYFISTGLGGFGYTCSAVGGDILQCPSSCPRPAGNCNFNEYPCGGSKKWHCTTTNLCYSGKSSEPGVCQAACGAETGTCFTATLPNFIVFTGDQLNYYPPKYVMAEAAFLQLYYDYSKAENTDLHARLGVMNTAGLVGYYAPQQMKLHPPCSGAGGDCKINYSEPASMELDILDTVANTISMPTAAGLLGTGQYFANDNGYFQCLMCTASGLSSNCTLSPSPIGDHINPGVCGQGAVDTMCQNCGWTCQKNYVILITDGIMDLDAGVVPTGVTDFNSDGDEYYLPEVAAWLANTDFRPDSSSSTCASQGSGCYMSCPQAVNTFVIGFATDPNIRWVLERTATNGHGLYAPATNYDTLLKKMEEFLRDIVSKNRFFAAPSVPAFSTSIELDMYLSSFVASRFKIFWPGHLRYYKAIICQKEDVGVRPGCDSDGEVVFVDKDGVPFPESFGGTSSCGITSAPQPPEPIWDAGNCLSDTTLSCYTSPSNRLVYTVLPSAAGIVGAALTRITPALCSTIEFCQALGNGADIGTADCEYIVNYILGPKEVMADITTQADCPTSDGAQWLVGTTLSGTCFSGSVLGDIFHSDPVVIDQPREYAERGCSTLIAEAKAAYDGYNGFVSQNVYRKKIVLAGANDGMLHAFSAGDVTGTAVHPIPSFSYLQAFYGLGTGKELWAFIPTDLLPKLKNMIREASGCGDHEYLVDAPVMARDAWWKSTNKPSNDPMLPSEWHSVVVGGERMGGRHFYALELISDTTTGEISPQFMWYFPNDITVANPGGSSTSEIGYTWQDIGAGKASIGPVDVMGFSDTLTDPGPIWAVFLNGGYMPDTNGDGIDDAGTGIYALNIKTGEKIWEFKYTSGSDEKGQMKYSFPASVAPVDVVPDGFDCKFDNIIAVDRASQLWRFDIGTTLNHTPGDVSTGSGGLIIGTTPNVQGTWYGARVFAAPFSDTAVSTPQILTFNRPGTALSNAFQGQLEVQRGKATFRDLRAYFGTGDRTDPLRCRSPQDRFYAVSTVRKDFNNTAPNALETGTILQESDLYDATVAGANSDTEHGFFMRLALAGGEKVLRNADLAGGNTLFTTYTPDPVNCDVTSDLSCEQSGAGTSWLYEVDYLRGTEPVASSLIKITTTGRFVRLGEGLPSTPQVSEVYFGGRLYFKVITITSEAPKTLGTAGGVTNLRPPGLMFWLDVPRDLHDFLKSAYGITGIRGHGISR